MMSPVNKIVVSLLPILKLVVLKRGNFLGIDVAWGLKVKTVIPISEVVIVKTKSHFFMSQVYQY